MSDRTIFGLVIALVLVLLSGIAGARVPTRSHASGFSPSAMARSHSQCEVLHQDFPAMQLPENRFDGVFANASLFHVPSQELPKVLQELFKTLKPRGVLFSSNPRGNNEESFSDDRYACFFDLDTWRDYDTHVCRFRL